MLSPLEHALSPWCLGVNSHTIGAAISRQTHHFIWLVHPKHKDKPIHYTADGHLYAA